MHEMSITQEIIEIIRQEMDKHGVRELREAVVVHGQLTNIVPDAMQFAWEALTRETDLEGSTLVTREEPLQLTCGGCGHGFSPEDLSAVFAPCPECGEQLGHQVVAGRELYIENIEAI